MCQARPSKPAAGTPRSMSKPPKDSHMDTKVKEEISSDEDFLDPPGPPPGPPPKKPPRARTPSRSSNVGATARAPPPKKPPSASQRADGFRRVGVSPTVYDGISDGVMNLSYYLIMC